MSEPIVDIGDIRAAAERIDGVAVHTPLIESPALNAMTGGRVLLKPENLQLTGSFKIRGAYNLLASLDADDRAKGAVAWSSGNHAQGVARAGQLLGIETTIVMPEDAPRAKLDKTRDYGGKVVTYDRYTGDREAIARDIAAQSGAVIVPSYDHPLIIAGQGTAGLEIAEDAIDADIELDAAVICCGGGGLTAGSATAIKALLPRCEIYTAEPDAYDDTRRSLDAGERVAADTSVASICDALLSPMPGALTFPVLARTVTCGLAVSEDEVRDAMRFACRELKLVLEPGGAVALAAIIAGRLDIKGKTVAVMLSGGNVDAELFAEIQAELN